MCYAFEINTLPIEKHFHLRCIKIKQPSNQIDVTQCFKEYSYLEFLNHNEI